MRHLARLFLIFADCALEAFAVFKWRLADRLYGPAPETPADRAIRERGPVRRDPSKKALQPTSVRRGAAAGARRSTMLARNASSGRRTCCRGWSRHRNAGEPRNDRRRAEQRACGHGAHASGSAELLGLVPALEAEAYADLFRRELSCQRRLRALLPIARQSGLERSDNQDGNPAPQYWHDRRSVSVVQEPIEGLIVAARRSGVGRDCRVDRRAAAASLAFKRSATAVAFDVHLEDGGVMNEAVNDRDRHCLVREDFAPFAKRLVGSDEDGSPLITGADEFEKHAGFGLVLGDVGDVIEDSADGICRAWQWRLRERARGGRFAAAGRDRWFG